MNTRWFLVGLLFLSIKMGAVLDSSDLRNAPAPAPVVDGTVTPPPAQHHVITDQEQDAFTQRHQALANGLESRLRNTTGTLEQRIARLQCVAQRAHTRAQEVQGNGNAAYRTSGGFYNRYSSIAHRAENSLRHLQEESQTPQANGSSHDADDSLGAIRRGLSQLHVNRHRPY